MASSTPTTPGTRHARLTAVEPAGFTGGARRRPLWRFACDCGNETVAALENVRGGHTRSCGCLGPEVWKKNGGLPGAANGMFKHGLSYKSECLIWHGMLRRCLNPKAKNFKRYGGRGIKVCDRWRESFETFLADMGPRPSRYHSLDRIDPNGNYEPGNCRWATAKQQARNTRRTRIVSFQGRQMPLADACELTGVVYTTALARLNAGWDVERALVPYGAT